MVQVTLSYTIEATNTGIQHDLTCGCSLLDPSTGEELVMLPWWVIWNVPTGAGSGVTINASGDIPAGTYQAKARVWENHSGGTKVSDLDSVGALYTGGILTGILDEAVRTLVISGVPGEIAAIIDNFTITI